MNTYSPPAELPRNVGELTGTTPLTNAERYFIYEVRRTQSGGQRWFRALKPRVPLRRKGIAGLVRGRLCDDAT